MNERETVYKGGEIASVGSAKPGRGDVHVRGGMVVRVGEDLDVPAGAEVVDCGGMILIPGLFDIHVHAREPGREDKETIRTASEAAINGGVTGMVLMPNTSPAIDSGGLVQSVLDIAKEKARIAVLTSGCITKGRLGVELAGIAGMRSKGVLMLTDDGDPVPNPLVLRRAMEYADDFGMFLASHCEVKELSGSGAMHEGAVSYRMGIPGIPACSEEICLDRDIRLAQHTGAHVHIQHVTTARGMETIRRYKNEGVRVTAEVSPHHLIFNHEDIVDYDTHLKMNPPLRTKEDNERLLEGLIEGVFDCIATDHAPHTDFEKNQGFSSAPFGITGLETALPSLFHYFIKTGKFGWDLLVRRYSEEPRKLMQLEPIAVAEGQRAEFVLFDPGAKTVFTKEFMRSKSTNTPFLNREISGRVVGVIYGGKELLDRDGE